MAIFAHFIVSMSEIVKATAALLCISEAFVSCIRKPCFYFVKKTERLVVNSSTTALSYVFLSAL